jgi:predicted TIM-barrel fold metal-dependent hydrolase
VQLIDTHAHFWDPRHLNYSWLRDNPRLNRPYLVQDYPPDPPGTETEALVFVECDANPGQSLQEITFVEQQAQHDPRVRAIVAHAPLEHGKAAEPLLAQIVSSSPKIRGIRRILQSEHDLSALVKNSALVEGISLLPHFGLHFEITATYTQMDAVLELVQQLPQVPMILDHCGKPGIRNEELTAFQHHARALSRYPNVHCKLSGLTTEADHEHWTDAQLLPYIDTALQTFGPNRLLYGSDWPVCLLATSLPRWIGVLDQALAGCPPADKRKILRDNANTLYRLGMD